MRSSKQYTYPGIGGMKRVRLTVVGLIGLALISVAGSQSFAQQRIESTSELKMACETGPGNVVTLNQSTKVFRGFQPPATEEVVSGCTIVLGAGSSLEFEGVSMSFAGALVVQSADKGEMKITLSRMTAPSLTFSLAGTGSALAMSQSSLQAAKGSITVALGDDGKVEIIGRNLRGGGSSEVLRAVSSIQISGGRKFSGVIAGISGPNFVLAPHGVRITMDGGEGLLKVDDVFFQTDQGSVAITASGSKSLVEMSSARLRFGDAAVIRLAGIESGIKLKQVFAGGADGRVAPAGVHFEAGMGSADNGQLEVSEFSTGDVSSVTMRASRNGQKGSLKIEKSSVSSNGDAVFETGPSGRTEVKENSVFSGTRIRVASGPGGSCVAQPNVLSAPVVEACP